MEEDIMNLTNKIKKLRKIDIYFAAVLVAGMLTVLIPMQHPEIQVWVNAHPDVVIGIALICMAILFREELVEVGGAIMLYLLVAIGLSFVPLLLGLPPIVVVITMFIVTAIVSIAMATMPSKGSAVERFFHRRKLVFNVRLVSY